MSDPRKSSVNTGIQANTVTADVLAVGDHARASKVVNSGAASPELLDSLAALRAAIAAMPLAPPAKAALEEEVVHLDKAAAGKDTPPAHVQGVLGNIVGKLKMVGVLMSDAAAIAGPLKKIATLFGVPIPW
jgi:hypothetical protein